MNFAAAAVASDAARQHYLFEARQLQALSFAVHIPLVCFGIAFPALVVFCEWLGRRTGDEIYLTIARRWSKVMAALFAAGVVTGTILSFELGILWPAFMARFGAVFGLAFTLEGFSFFVEAIFIGIYIYGWDRMSPRLHLLAGVPIIVAGIAGSLMVITVNGWMNHPGGFRIVDGRVVDVHPWSALFDNRTFWHELVHMYLAGYMVVGFWVAAVYAWGWLRGRQGRYERIAIAIPLAAAVLAAPLQIVVGDWAGRDVARYQPTKLAAFEGLGQTTKGAPVHLLGWYTDGHVRFGIKVPDLLSLLAFHDPNATVDGARHRAGCRSPSGERRAHRVPDDGRDRHAARRPLPGRAVDVVAPPPLTRVTLVLPRPRAGGSALAGGADRGLGDDRGRAPAMDRVPRHADRAGGHGRGRDPRRATACSQPSYVGLAVAVWWVLRRLAAAPLPEERGA